MKENFETLLEESLANIVIYPGKIMIGHVVEANDDYVVVNAGLKSDSEIPAEEFKSSAGVVTVQVGDKVEVVLEAVEDGTGSTKLSRERAIQEKSWTNLSQAQKEGKIVNGIITDKVKGGFTVEINNLRAFLPGSLVDIKPVRDTTYIEGKEFDFKIIKLDRQRNNIVVSRRAIVEHELSEEREKLLDTLEEGQIVRGSVKNLTDYGAFINLGGLDGLLHITDLSWKRVKHPSEILNIGDEIETRVLKFDKERCRVSLGLKQLGEDPWIDLSRRYSIKTRLFGKVTNITDYGAFVGLEEGVEGLVHLSEMDWTNKNIHPGKFCQLGDEVEVMILDIDPERRRISLGMKQCLANPWEQFALNHKKGDILTGSIRSITDFGIFIGVEGGIDGLVHLSDLSWDRPGEEIVTEYQKGDELIVVVLAVDPERERISLGLKQANEDHFSNYLNENGKGSSVTGIIKDVTAKGAIVELTSHVEGYLKAAEMSRDRVDDARTIFHKGDHVKAKIMSIERKDRRIYLSMKMTDMELQEESIKNYSQNSNKDSVTLGGKLREQLSKQLN